MNSASSECIGVALETAFLHDIWYSTWSVIQGFCERDFLIQVVVLTYNRGPKQSCLESLLDGGMNVLFHFLPKTFLVNI